MIDVVLECGMARPPVLLRERTPAEQRAIEQGLRSVCVSAFTRRRCQILSLYAQGQGVPRIASALGCGRQTIRDTVRAFNAGGEASLSAKSHATHSARPALEGEALERLGRLVERGPREFGVEQTFWSLHALARVVHEQGLTPERDRPLSHEAIRQGLLRLGLDWKRARKRLVSADPAYARKKTDGTG